jgi:hypothetical protein
MAGQTERLTAVEENLKLDEPRGDSGEPTD